MIVRLAVAVVVAGVAAWPLAAQSAPAAVKDDIRQLKLKDWEPRPMLVAKTTIVEKPRYPVVDMHNHLGGGQDRLTPAAVAKYLREMDEAGVRTVVNLDGGWGDRLKETVAALDRAHPGRFLTYALVNFAGAGTPGWGEREARRLAESFAAGAKGLKFHKSFGLSVRKADGTLLAVDDPQLDPVWAMCATHGRPVVIHVADPAAFFTPLDRFNERWHELNEHPDWLFHGPPYPPRQDLLDALHRVVGRHPKTTFVNTHFGNNAEDLAAVAAALDKYPNMFVDLDARISELGRQPYAARRFFLQYQDRILFGTDTNPNRESYRVYYRFLETDDEYFDCAASHHRQGFWRISGLALPAPVLDKVYRRNAERVLYGMPPGADAPGPKELRVPRTADFAVTGRGEAPAWEKAEWQPLSPRRPDGLPYTARFKALHSGAGVYFLMDGTDAKLTASFAEDFQDLWTEDVFEVFLWPDERDRLYFEYEISPLGKELPIIVPNHDGHFLGWRPWHYEGNRKIKKAVAIFGGAAQPGAAIAGWRAELFIPYELLNPLRNVPPRPGTRWRANFYRVDHDGGKKSAWDWSRVGSDFHEIDKFGTLVFE